MCIAILKTKDGKITDQELRNCFQNNKDGAGIAYTVNNKITIKKGIFNEDEFVKAVRDAELICDNNMLIHCRISTSGNIDYDNCHPFIINDTAVMIHNGILDIDVPAGSKLNDTRIYINTFLKNFTTYDLLHNKGLKKLIEYSIKSNKFVIMDNEGNYTIMNEDVGKWRDGVWFSNDSYSYSRFSFFEYSYFTPKSIQEATKVAEECHDEIMEMTDYLEYDDFIELGKNPYFDFDYLTYETRKENKSCFRLKSVDKILYDYYLFKYHLAVDNDEEKYYKMLANG